MYSLEVFDHPLVLKKLAQTWQSFSDFRLACTLLDDAEALLNVLSVLDSGDYETRLSAELAHWEGGEGSSAELRALHLFWGRIFNAALFGEFFSLVEGAPIAPPEGLDSFLEEISARELDPFFKVILLQKYCAPTLMALKKPAESARLLTTFLGKHFGLIKTPVFYPVEFAKFSLSFELDIGGVTSMLEFLKSICLLGAFTIEAVSRELGLLKAQMSADPQFSRVAEAREFTSIFSSSVLTIPKLMGLTGWKRDKAARLLALMARQNYFEERKYGKEKFFINRPMLNLFTSDLTLIRSFSNAYGQAP